MKTTLGCSAVPDFLLCDHNHVFTTAGSMSRVLQKVVAISHVGGGTPWCVFDPERYPSRFPTLVAFIHPDGMMEVVE